MPRRALAALSCLAAAPLAGAAAAGCGGGGATPPSACLRSPAAIEQALARAPAPVRLADGSRISTCVDRARSDGDLQSVGAVLTQAADQLLRRAVQAPGAALELGYLIGAIERGGQRTNGISAELVRRVEQDGGALERGRAVTISALRQGLAAGRASG